jgi:hypothetical protein
MMRIHVGTFDVDDDSVSPFGLTHNHDNCDNAARLFQGQPGVKVRFWCEQGRYRTVP